MARVDIQLALQAVYLDRAQQYSESALSAVAADSRTFSIGQVTARELSITQSIGSYLDTLGWVAFAKGDLETAELVAAGWWIGEQGKWGITSAKSPQGVVGRMTRDRLVEVAGKDASVEALTRQHAAELARCERFRSSRRRWSREQRIFSCSSLVTAELKRRNSLAVKKR